MSIPYEYFDPVIITDFTEPDIPLAAPGVLMTWLDLKNNILNRYPTRDDFIANGTSPYGAYTRIFPNFPDSWDLMLMNEGNSFVFPEGHFGGTVFAPPYNHPPSPVASYANNFMGLAKIDVSYNNQEFSGADYLTPGPTYVWGWEDNSGGGVPYFSGFTFNDALDTTFDDCFLKINVDTILPKETGVSYGTGFELCIGSRVIDIDGLADWIYGIVPPPIGGPVAFGMEYPPTDPGSTDILVPQHVIPPIKRRIPFQNYTMNIPRMIKK